MEACKAGTSNSLCTTTMNNTQASGVLKTLDYQVIRYSGFSGSYTPDHILVDKPSDQTSRWSSDSNSPTQFVTVRLARPAVVKRVKFGKYEKTHVCNLKRFKVFGGLAEEGMLELTENGLKNDPTPEIFPLRHKVNGKTFPCQYLKIVPLQSWGPTFNFSIWYIEFLGEDEPDLVTSSTAWFNEYKESQAVRLCLKYLRDRNHLDLCSQLEERTGFRLEHELISQLYDTLVVGGDLFTTERILFHAHKEGFFDEYVNEQSYTAEWAQLSTKPSEEVPGMRGGHQMVIDCASDTIYLLGGWDGCSDLADFWKYNIESGRWTCISEDTAAEGGPGPRSCHRMVLDTEGQRIFILGKYIEPEARTAENVASDFYSYHIDSGSWNLLCEDTACYGGPQLIYEHQMVIDMERQIIYCFGGRILTISSVPADPRTRFFDSPIDSQFSGLYAYCIPTNTWRLLRDDGDNGDGIMRSRTGHSMLFCPVDRKLYVFAGQRNKQLLNDFVVYDADTNTACSVADDTGAVATIPSLGSTQRATIDSDKREIYVLSGTMKAKSKDTGLKNAFWVYRLDTAEWTCVFENENSAQTSRDTLPTREQVLSVLRLRKQQQLQQREPCPRYAHQIVYDPGRKLHYLFGGNPGTTKQTTSTTRLDDFWQLMLVKPTTDDILRNCRWKLRKRILMDLLKTDRVKAVEYLQREMSQVVNLKDPLETTKSFLTSYQRYEMQPAVLRSQRLPFVKQFQQLAHRLFTEPEKQADFLTVRDRNKALFSSIIRFFPVNTRPPVENLIDIIKL